MTRGETRMMEIKKNESLEKIKKNKLKKDKDKIFPFANKGICPECGKDLDKTSEVVCFIDGEYGDMEFAIDCSCGYKYSTMSEEFKKKDYDYYKNLYSSKMK